ncbi:hypothetical protein FH972_008288 [Carpinus fangiana]|uniref:Protein FAR1-RELATED SEQUENCE n=1 Tax=Carpinus fangiana TaxID=176857 RepID=A0A5N6R1L6_9ROSI|nr:hypothetical protein FH972_008288 [Carpinus fangiana]KAE8022494.1 hypothetical protein FH972_008288 [Carpinus fangiana]
MDGDDEDLSSPLEENRDMRLQASHNLDLNMEQDCRSPKFVHSNSTLSSLSLNDEASKDAVLKIGTEFESDEHAYKFYNKYARLVGFSVRKDWVNRSKVHGQVVSRKFTCSKEGYRRKDKRDVNVKKHRRETRTGCLAHMIITRQPDGKYRVTHFEAQHNHDNVNPTNAQTLQLQRELSCSSDAEAGLENNLGSHSKSAFESMTMRFEVQESLDELAIDYDNYLQSERLRDMKEGEAGRLLHYFQRQHFENPSFFYTTQLDIDDKVTNIFWADDNMVVDYDHFNDAVCLDTSSRANKDFRPFVQFLGVNHHKQVVIFAAALLYDDTVESFKWLFRTFIEAMFGKKPKAILTDQDAAIVEAINSVLPETSHRICVWQMYQNALKHLSNVIKDTDSFAIDLKSCIYFQKDEEDFVNAWEAMVDKYGLQQNEWLRWMFREREKWAVVYGRNTFFIDMNGSHLGEYLFNNLRNQLNSDLDILHFFKFFERVIDEQRYKETEADDEMSRCMPRLMGNVVLLKHASDVYTPRAFEVFQRGYEKSLNVVVNKCSQNGSLLEYKANTFGQVREHTVTFNSSDNTVNCSCMKYEYVGFLCSHALKVLDHSNIKVVPSRYILKRWTKDGRSGSMRDSYEFTIQDNPKLVVASRYKNLCQKILKLSARASESEEAFEFAARQLDEMMEGVENILNLKPEDAQALSSSSTGANASESEHAEIFLDGNAIDDQDENRVKGVKEKEVAISTMNGKASHPKVVQNIEASPPIVTFISSSPTSYISPQATTANPIMQGICNFEANQVVHCMYQQPNLVMDQQSNPNIYQPPNFFSNQPDSPGQSHLLQAMDLDVQHPHSSSFLLYDGYRASNVYLGPK